MLSSMSVVLRFYEKDIPVDEFSCVSSMIGMQLKGVKCMIFQNLVLGSMIFLRQRNMMEQDRIFVFVYVNSFLSWILECGLALDQGVSAQLTKDCLWKAVAQLQGKTIGRWNNR